MENQTKSIFLDLYCMVIADGNVASEEMETLYRIGKKEYQISEKEINEAVLVSGTSFYIPDTLDGKVTFLYHLAEIAWADGKIENSEKHLLKKYALRFGFYENNVDDLIEYLLQQVKDKVSINEVLINIK